MTFTILAADPRTGELGAASFSFVLAVGARVVHYSPGDGLVAVQALGDPAWAGRLLSSLGTRTWQDAVAELAREPGFQAGQLAGLSTAGEAFAFTGSGAESFAGTACEQGVCCAANLMAVDSLPARALERFRSLDPALPLARRLVESVRHADGLGGDIRGRMSAFVRTFHRDPGYRPVDLRVDYHPDPVSHLVELERIERAHRLVAASMDRNGSYTDLAATRAAHELAPESPVTGSAHLLALLRTPDGGGPEAVRLAGGLDRRDPGLRERLRRAESAGRLPAGTTHRLFGRGDFPD